MGGTTHPRGRRHLPKSVRVNLHGARRPSTREIDEAIAQVLKSGVVPVLTTRLHRRRDAEERLSLIGYEVALTLHSFMKGHQMHLVEIVRVLNSLQRHTLDRLGMPLWAPVGSYDRFQRLHALVSAALDEGWRHADPATGEVTQIDRDWYRRRLLRAAVPTELVRGCALAVDGTDVPTWGRLHGDVDAVEVDDEDGFDEDEP